MALASSSAARFHDAALDDSLAGLEAANDAYGSLAGLATRPKPKKKPVLVLDAAELAEAHALFQLGAAEQLEDADQIERRPVMLGLAPIGSDMAPDTTPDDDEDEYTVEADAPAPEDVLGLTRAEPIAPDAAPRSFKKSMVVLPPDGDPALDAIEPFVPMAPSDEEENWPEDELGQDDLPEEPVAEELAAEELVAEELLPETDAVEQLPEEQLAEPVDELLPDPEPLPTALDLTFEEAEAPPSDDAPTEDLAPQFDLEQPAAPDMEPEPAPFAQEQDDDSITRVEDDEVDGLAFMRGPERRKISIADVPPTSHNSLRARLVREEDMVIEDFNPTKWERFTAWLGDAWRRFLS